jgi:CBS domain-containing protein
MTRHADGYTPRSAGPLRDFVAGRSPGRALGAAAAEAYDRLVATDASETAAQRAAHGAPADVLSFLRSHPPFDVLAEDDLAGVADAAEVEFFLAGATIYSQGAHPVEHLRVVRTGAVEIVLAGHVLDVLGAGELFGHASMLSGLPPGFTARAEQDTLCYRIPQSVAARVLARPETVGFVARSLLTMNAKAPFALAPREAAPDPANQPVKALLRGEPVICGPATPIREAAEAMTAAGASAAVVDLGDRLGILTDRDLRTRVVAGGLPYDAPVEAAMSAPAYTAREDALGGEILLEMLDRGIGHFPVLSATKNVIGVVRAIDLHAPETLSSFRLRRAIARADSFAELGQEAAGLRSGVVALHDAQVGAVGVQLVYSVLLDALTRRTIELALADVPAPAQFSWLALGSQARREALPGSDLDSAVAWYGSVAEEDARPGLVALAGTITRQLAGYGLPVDTHGATAADSVFVRAIESWQHVARERIADPTKEKALILVSLLVDSRPVWGVHMGNQLSDVFLEARSRSDLLHLLGRLALAHRPPTGFRRALVLDHDGASRGELDIKRRGLLPIVDLARWAGIAAGVTGASTSERLRAAADEGTLPLTDARTLEDAYELFAELRLANQVAQLKAGSEPHDRLDTNQLSPLTRSHLKEAFRAVASVQRRVASQLGLSVL